MEPDDYNELEEQSFLERHKLAVGAGLLVIAIGAVVLALQMFSHSKGPSKAERLQMVQLLPPPPPPPPPPPQPKATPTPEMIKQEKMIEPESKPKMVQEKPKDAPPKPNQAPPGPLGLNTKGEGQSDSFGLVGRPGGNGFGDGDGGGGSRFGWYASEVVSRTEQALRNNPHTRDSSMGGVPVRIWVSNSGRVTRVQLDQSTGNPAIDNAITNEALNGLQFQDAPPQDMPMPIHMRITARRPN